MREEIEKEGGLKLIYIDPPFAVGADFSFNIEINGEIIEKWTGNYIFENEWQSFRIKLFYQRSHNNVE